jgi:hypothetical protein
MSKPSDFTAAWRLAPSMNSASFSLLGDMSLITDHAAWRARLREIQRLTLAIQKARVRDNARRQ